MTLDFYFRSKILLLAVKELPLVGNITRNNISDRQKAEPSTEIALKGSTVNWRVRRMYRNRQYPPPASALTAQQISASSSTAATQRASSLIELPWCSHVLPATVRWHLPQTCVRTATSPASPQQSFRAAPRDIAQRGRLRQRQQSAEWPADSTVINGLAYFVFRSTSISDRRCTTEIMFDFYYTNRQSRNWTLPLLHRLAYMDTLVIAILYPFFILSIQSKDKKYKCRSIHTLNRLQFVWGSHDGRGASSPTNSTSNPTMFPNYKNVSSQRILNSYCDASLWSYRPMAREHSWSLYSVGNVWS